MKSTMTRERVEQYGNLRSEIIMLTEQIAAEEIQAVSDTVQTSSDSMPYSKHIIAVRGYATKNKSKLVARKKRKEAECDAIEEFIDSVDDSLLRQLLTRLYIESRTLKQSAAIVGYSTKQASRIIGTFFEKMSADVR